MSSTSAKHRNFVSEPIGEKEVGELAGIGDVLGGRLRDKGFDKVSRNIVCITSFKTRLYFILTKAQPIFYIETHEFYTSNDEHNNHEIVCSVHSYIIVFDYFCYKIHIL